jgi:hypothetical protein
VLKPGATSEKRNASRVARRSTEPENCTRAYLGDQIKFEVRLRWRGGFYTEITEGTEKKRAWKRLKEVASEHTRQLSEDDVAVFRIFH